MIDNAFSERAEQAAERYRLAIRAFVSVYQAMAQITPSAGSIRRMSEELVEIAEVHGQGESELLALDLDWVAEKAQEDAALHLGHSPSRERDLPVSEALSASQSYVMRELSTQLQRDASQTLRQYRSIGLKAEIHRRATGLSRDASHLAVLEADQPLRHWFQDRAGRRWPSRKFVRTLWRGALHGLYSEIYALELAKRGETRLILWHPDVNSSLFGEEVDLTVPGMAVETMRQILHPNTRALPRAATWFEENTA